MVLVVIFVTWKKEYLHCKHEMWAHAKAPSHAKPYHARKKEKNSHPLMAKKWRQQGNDRKVVAVVLCPIKLGEHWCMHIL